MYINAYMITLIDQCLYSNHISIISLLPIFDIAVAACGFRKNDIIVEVNGEDVTNSEDADVLLDRCRPGA